MVAHVIGLGLEIRILAQLVIPMDEDISAALSVMNVQEQGRVERVHREIRIERPLFVLLCVEVTRYAHRIDVGRRGVRAESDPTLLDGRQGQVLVADKGYASAEFESRLTEHGVELIRPSKKGEKPRRGARQLKPIRQIIESINATLKTKLSLERHGGHSHQGVAARILQRLLALTAAIWHNHHTRQPVLRSLTAYDH